MIKNWIRNYKIKRLIKERCELRWQWRDLQRFVPDLGSDMWLHFKQKQLPLESRITEINNELQMLGYIEPVVDKFR